MDTANSPARILLVEDDRTLHRLILRELQNEGWTAQGCRTSVEARQRLRQHSVSLVILDWDLSGGEAGRLLHYLQAAQPSPPLIVISGETPYLEELADLPISRVLVKPFDIRLLVRYVRRLLPQANDAEPNRFSHADARLADQALTALQRDPALRGAGPFRVEAQDGVVTLYGPVQDPAQRRAASQTVTRIPTATIVINRLHLSKPENPPV